MAQTIAEIKKIMTDKFMTNESVISLYGVDPATPFEAQFSKVSIESILFYCFAYCVWTLQMIFDTDKAEMLDLIETKKPHRRKWYRDKALAFRFGRLLVKDDDIYNLGNIDPQTITSELVVQFAAAVEYQGKLYIKIAGGTLTSKSKLSDEIEVAINEYFDEIKDAGVKFEIVNKEADHFMVIADIYYNPMILGADGKRLSDGSDVVRDAIKDYVQNAIDFNGEYRNVSLVDRLQTVEGVVIPELWTTKTVTHDVFVDSVNYVPWQPIPAKCLPESGYFKIYDDADLDLTFKPYQVINE